MSGRNTEMTGIHLWLVLMKAQQALQRHALRSIASSRLCFSDFAVLEILLHKGPLPVNALGVRVSLTSGSATAAIDRIEKKGLVRRAPHATDRRTRIVHLTRQDCSPRIANHPSPTQRRPIAPPSRRLYSGRPRRLSRRRYISSPLQPGNLAPDCTLVI